MLITSFLEYLRLERNYSERTVESYSQDLRKFEEYVRGFGEDVALKGVDADIVRSWVVVLMDKGEKPTSVNRRLSSLRSFYKFLLKRNEVSQNPASQLPGPKKARHLPMFIRENEIDVLLDDVSFGSGYKAARDKMMIHVLYMTGLRISELVGLDVADVDFSNNQLRVLGKRNKQRIVPFDRELAASFESYLAVRESFCSSLSSTALFLGCRGGRISRCVATEMIKQRLAAVSTSEKRSAHVLRHTFATSMLNHDADLESIRQLLGHESLVTTEIYTHTTFEELKKIYKNAHPRA